MWTRVCAIVSAPVQRRLSSLQFSRQPPPDGDERNPLLPRLDDRRLDRGPPSPRIGVDEPRINQTSPPDG